MKSATTLFCILLLATLSLRAQPTVAVRGNVMDTEGTPLMAATVVVLQPEDSVMVTYSITDAQGNFAWPKLSPGKYILQMAFMGYQDISQELHVPSEKASLDLGTFVMQEKTAQLGEVTVQADHIPLMIRGDTIDYNARAYNTDANAPVEDLLRKLPGVEINPDGSVSAQGEEVQRLLVDGKEFFGNDPTIATRNLPADAIERVKVYDGASESSQFTGVDDGRRIKTIDLTLREDKKHGIFGKLGAGYGTQEVYSLNGNANRFGENTQVSVLGGANNRNQPGFSMNDYINFQGGMSALSGGGGTLELEMPGGGGSNQTGITTSQAAGINFNHEFSDQLDLRSSYFYNGAGNVLEGTSLRQSLLTDNAYSTDEGTNRTTGQGSHRLNLRNEWEVPEKRSLMLNVSGQMSQNEGQSQNTSETYNGEGTLTNEQTRENRSLSNTRGLDGRLLYQQLFAKKGRVLSFAGEGSVQNQAANQWLLSDTRFFEGGTWDTELIDQRQEENQENLSYEGQITFTEPLGAKRFLETSYTRSTAIERYGKDFYDRTGESEVLNTTLSNAFTKRYTTDAATARLLVNENRYNFSAGLTFQNSLLVGELASDVPLERQFANWLPNLRAEYEFTSSKSLRLNYRTNLNAPSLQQLQPVINNSNPLVNVVGNPDLQPEYRHDLSLGYHSFNQLNFTSFFAMVQANYTQGQITNTQTIDDQFRQTIRPVNTDAGWGGSGFASFSFLLKPIKTSVRLNGNWRYNAAQQWVNGVQNLTDRNSGSVRLSLDNKKKELLDWTVGTVFGLTDVKYSELTSLNQRYSNLTYFTNVRVPLGERWKVATTFDYQQYLGAAFGGTQTVPLWSASLSRTFGKREQAELKLLAFDLLNQNVGISRTANLNYIEDVQYNALTQYFLLTFTYSLNRFGGGNNGIVFKSDRMEL